MAAPGISRRRSKTAPLVRALCPDTCPQRLQPPRSLHRDYTTRTCPGPDSICLAQTAQAFRDLISMEFDRAASRRSSRPCTWRDFRESRNTVVCAVPAHWHHRMLIENLRRASARSEEHTSELQSQSNLVCRLLLEKKKDRHAPVRETGRLIPRHHDLAAPLRPIHVQALAPFTLRRTSPALHQPP